ncbi:Lon protease family protein [Futiania mangrovi]|uniref:endopeptidase La n=1 Tax=Futiania mangrovi TaxID=2959716 RepID=A0A9J6PLJ4_9PROT|nr:ATP-binding protein [Futiania mangrovii]MCP1336914.1 AAA family ATPase [Futiania mangrovii]
MPPTDQANASPDVPPALTPDALRRRCDPEALGFSSTEDLEPLGGFLGQSRALDALAFGTGIVRTGFNMFVLGTPGSGRHTAVRAYLGRLAADQETPDDWVYVNDFGSGGQKPNALRLPTGRGRDFRDRIKAAVEELTAALPAVFDSDEYRRRRRVIDEEFEEAQEQAFEALRKKAEAREIAVLRTPVGFALAPMKNGKVVEPDVFKAWDAKAREAAQASIAELQEDLRRVLEQVPRFDKARRERIRDLDREFAAIAVDQSLDEVREAFADLPEVSEHLDAVRADMVEQAGAIAQAAGESDVPQARRAEAPGFRRYMVNLIVAGGDGDEGAPVVHEDNPTLPNLVGRIEHLQQMGTLVTDFMMIKAGALHRANGGYLLLDARKVLTQPMAWEALKRALRSGCIVIESLAEHFSLVSTVSLEPEPIPFSAKVVLFGERYIYYLLCALDPEFEEIFKVAVDFDDDAALEGDTAQDFARLVAAIVKNEGLLPFDAASVARLVEYAGRLVDDTQRISVRLGPIADLAREADHWARAGAAPAVTAAHVIRAERERIRRLDRLRERARESVSREIRLIATDGEAVGQVNGLSVLQLGTYAFGSPTRITARVRLGTGKLIDIERETELGGPIHSKGVLILSGLLAARYALDWPVSLSASLVFEQSYGGVEGDSASTAELCALLSAIAEVPLRQDLALTGSVNQFGEVQAIGGVNEKIEGFFEVCSDRGLTGRQGVLIPQANVQHLMLRDDVVAACARGDFAVHAIGHVDEAMTLLTGLPAGARDAAGSFPQGSVNARVEARLIAMARRRQELGLRDRPETPKDRDGTT